MNGYYITNMESLKLELHFDKDEYMALPDSDKQEIKSNFLFSRKAGGWVSRAKFPRLSYAERVAKNLGLENHGKSGETLSFAEMQEQKAERAINRAERYDNKSESASERGEQLQSTINSMSGDIAYFTQPVINTSAGLAFARQRQRAWDSYEKGWEEFKKSEYYAKCAETARETAASCTSPSDIGFCGRRIKEAEASIRAQNRNIKHYDGMIERIQNGETLKGYSGEVYTVETINGWIEDASIVIEQNMSKIVYYKEAIEALGGIKFTKDDVKKGYTIKRHGSFRNEKLKVVSVGRLNVKCEYLEGGAKGLVCQFPFAEIEAIISTEISEEIEHPFTVGETYELHGYTYTIDKVTPDKVRLRREGKRAFYCNVYEERWNNNAWCFYIGNTTVYHK